MRARLMLLLVALEALGELFVVGLWNEGRNTSLSSRAEDRWETKRQRLYWTGYTREVSQLSVLPATFAASNL